MLPCLDFVEEFEEDRSKENVPCIGRKVLAVDDVAKEVLARTVGCAIGVGEFEASQDGVIGQWTARPP